MHSKSPIIAAESTRTIKLKASLLNTEKSATLKVSVSPVAIGVRAPGAGLK